MQERRTQGLRRRQLECISYAWRDLSTQPCTALKFQRRAFFGFGNAMCHTGAIAVAQPLHHAQSSQNPAAGSARPLPCPSPLNRRPNGAECLIRFSHGWQSSRNPTWRLGGGFGRRLPADLPVGNPDPPARRDHRRSRSGALSHVFGPLSIDLLQFIQR